MNYFSLLELCLFQGSLPVTSAALDRRGLETVTANFIWHFVAVIAQVISGLLVAFAILRMLQERLQRLFLPFCVGATALTHHTQAETGSI